MVDELRHRQRRYSRLSDSSRSDDDIPRDTEGLKQNPFGRRPEKSRKQNIRELREDFDYDPELYGIRRSERSRREPARFEVDREGSLERSSRMRGAAHSESESQGVDSSSESSSDRSVYRVSTGRFSGRTRGCRVNYTNAFQGGSDSDDDSYRRHNGNSVDNRAHRSVLVAGVNRTQPTLLQKPRGPLIRMSGKAPESYSNPEVPKQADMSDGESYVPHHGHSSNDSSIEDSRPTSVAYAVADGGQQEIDVIEEVLSHAVRRVGATGNSTTLYNSRLEKDPNEGFDPTKEEGEVQYLVKWRSWSHIHSTWETEASLTSHDRGFPVDGLKRLYAYQSMIEERKAREEVASRDELEAMLYEDERNELILSEKMEVDRIVAHSRDKKKGTVDYLCKWRRLDYRFCTWECGQVIEFLFPEAIEAYQRRCSSTALPNSRHELGDRPRFVRIPEQPDYIGGGNRDLRLRDYQLNGLNWIAHAWTRGNSVILADEMGLGKTVQAVSFLSHLFHEYDIYGPFLIVVPLSTIGSWQKEIELWAPELNLVVYVGDHISRQFIRENEWSRTAGVGGRRQQMLKFNICMTTYEILLKDKSWLGQVSWTVLVVDEAHRLKNDASQLYKALFAFDTNTRLLITGTPLQNSLRELWSLLHFLMPRQFNDWEEFEDNYSLQGQASSSDGYEAITRLHRIIEPFLLRRVKKDVEQSLPSKIERILRVEMSKKQATLYRLILTRNYDGLMKVTHGNKTSFINIMMELKKCCNHAHLIAPPAEEGLFKTSSETLRNLIRGSGKLMLLDKLLQRLRPQGHRVLIFSQMVRMLDIIAEYLQLRGWGFQRLDGSIRGELRKQALDHFNADGSTDFCFLLSTRAGGLGINLATADTVIIFDSDWNPQNDLQAQARAHRIGQTKQVSVYRLVVKDSVEEKIIKSATRKMLLDHLVIQRMDSGGNRGGGSSSRKSETKGQILTEILRHGAESIFKQNDEESAEVEVDIDDILNRAETRDADADEDPYNPANVLLSTFNVMTLDQSEQDDLKPALVDTGKPPKSWSEIIPEEMRENLKQVESQEALLDLELGPRRRKQVRTFQAGLDNDNYSTSSPSGSERTGKRPIRLSDKEVRALVRAMKRFPCPLERIETIAAEAELPSRTNGEVREIVETILDGCKAAIESTPGDEDNSKHKGPVYNYGKVAIAAKSLFFSLNHLEVLHKVLSKFSKEDRLNYDLPFIPKYVNWSNPWGPTDDAHLLVGVYEHGYDNWEAIKLDADLGLGSKLLPLSANERPQASHVRARVDYLLKTLRKHCAQGNNESSKKVVSRHHNKSSKIHKKKHPKRSLGYAQSEESSKPAVKPKSAEFVESDDTSSDSDGGPGEGNIPTATIPPLKIKKTPQKRHLKIENSDDRPPKKTRLNDAKLKNEPTIYNVSQSSISTFSKQEEEEFRHMRGPLFLKCKQHLHPIKKLFKQLENLENQGVTEGEKFDRVILGVGEHIRVLVSDIVDREERHTWRHLYWEFVQNFSEKDAFQLEQAYSLARKNESLKNDTSPMRSYDRLREDQDHKDRDHRHHRHRNSEGQRLRHRDELSSGGDGDRSVGRHRSRSRHLGSDSGRTEDLHANSIYGGSVNVDTNRYSSSATGDKRFIGEWSGFRRNLNNSADRSLKHRTGRTDWVGNSGNFAGDRYNNAFNRSNPGYSDAFNNPGLHNPHEPRQHNLNSASSSIPPPYSYQPPTSSVLSWQEQKSVPLLSAPPPSGSSIIPPPIVTQPSSSSRDPRLLFHNRQ